MRLFFFVIVVDYILRQSVDTINSKCLTIEPGRSKRHEAKHLTDLDYADDLVHTADQLDLAQALFSSLEEAAGKAGLC